MRRERIFQTSSWQTLRSTQGDIWATTATNRRTKRWRYYYPRLLPPLQVRRSLLQECLHGLFVVLGLPHLFLGHVG